MVNALTLVLVLGLVAAVVYALGVERTAAGTKKGASATKRAATSTAGYAAGGAMAGLAAGDALMQFVISDPATLIAAVTGALGTLGLAGLVDVTPLQFALLVGVLLVGYAAVKGGD